MSSSFRNIVALTRKIDPIWILTGRGAIQRKSHKLLNACPPRSLLGLSTLPIVELVVCDGSAGCLECGWKKSRSTVVYVVKLLSQPSFVVVMGSTWSGPAAKSEVKWEDWRNDWVRCNT